MAREKSERFLLMLSACFIAVLPSFAGNDDQHTAEARKYLQGLLYTRQEVCDWLNKKAFPFAKYDSELGWLLRDAHFEDGADGSWSAYRYDKLDERRMIAYADKPCRINTYGNSFTQCHQVSDGETTQEILAAHLCEPVRNFGVGGYSVYQAYLRMKREEKIVPAKYIIFNIYDDDHYRSLDSWRNIRVRKHPRFIEPPLPHVRVNVKKKEFIECPNPCPTEDSLYNLCDIDWVTEKFKDDFALNVMLAHQNADDTNTSESYEKIKDLSLTFGIETRTDVTKSISRKVQRIHTKAALFSTMCIVERIEKFAAENNKKVLYVLSYRSRRIAEKVKEGTRFDQEFVDFLQEKNLPYVDMMQLHLDDFSKFNLSIEDYLKRYYVGHYNPLGNFFQAFAIRDRLVPILEPKPVSYPNGLKKK